MQPTRINDPRMTSSDAPELPERILAARPDVPGNHGQSTCIAAFDGVPYRALVQRQNVHHGPSVTGAGSTSSKASICCNGST